MNPRYRSSPFRESRTERSRLTRAFPTLLLMIAALWSCAGLVVPAVGCAGGAGQHQALIRALPRGETFRNDGQPYVLLPTLRAGKEKGGDVQAGQVRPGDPVVSSREALTERGLFTIYRPAETPSAAMTPDTSVSAEVLPAYPVVLNERTGALGVVTRRLWLKLRDMRDTDPIAREYGLDNSFSNAAMRTSFYEVPGGADIWALRARLRSDPRVERVTLEVIDRVLRPR